MQNVHFTPSQIAQMLNVNESTIKRWVDKGLLKASITKGGHRRIYQEDLLIFRKENNYNKKHSYTLRKPRLYTNSNELWKEYYNLLLINYYKEAQAIITNEFLRNTPIINIVQKIIFPALGHVGDEWFTGNIEIHDEHRISFYIREQLITLNQLIPEPKKGKKVILACISGEWHEISLQVSALILKSHGYEPIILGVNTPEKEILKATEKWQAKIVIVIKIYNENRKNEYLGKLEEYMKKNKSLLIYGGNGWSKQWHQIMNKNNRKHIKHFGDISLLENEAKRLIDK